MLRSEIFESGRSASHSLSRVRLLAFLAMLMWLVATPLPSVSAQTVERNPGASDSEANGQPSPSVEQTPSGKPAEEDVADVRLKTDNAADVTLESAKASLERVKGNEDTPKEVRESYQKAYESMVLAKEYGEMTNQFRNAIETGPETTDKLDEQLKALLPRDEIVAATVVPGEVDKLQRAITDLKVELTGYKDSLSKTAKQLSELQDRHPTLGPRQSQLKDELARLEKQLQEIGASKEPESVTKVAEYFLSRAMYRKLAAEQKMIDQETLSEDSRSSLLAIREKLLKRQIENATLVLEHFQLELNRAMMSEADRIFATLPLDVPKNDVEAKTLADEVKALAEEYQQVARHRKAIVEPSRIVENQLNGLEQTYQAIKEELQLGSGGSKMAQILFELNEFAEAGLSVVELPTNLDSARLASFQVGNQLRNQSEIEDKFSKYNNANVKRLVELRSELLETLRDQYSKLSRSLADVEYNKKQFELKSTEVRSYVSEQLLGFGVRTCEPMSFSSVGQVPEGIRWWFSGKHLRELQTSFVLGIARYFVSAGLTVLAVIIILVFRNRFVQAIQETGTKICRISNDRFSYTLAALGWTILLAAPLPLIIGLVAKFLARTPNASDWMHGLSTGVWQANWIVAGSAFIVGICRPGGIGVAHFGWDQGESLRFARSIVRYTWLYVPLYVIAASMRFGDAAQYFGGLGRACFMVAMVWCSLLMIRLYLVSRSDGQVDSKQEATELFSRWRHVWFPIMFLAPIVLIVVSWQGYLWSAMSLSQGILVSAGILLVGDVCYCLALRWFKIKQRKLALSEAIEARRAKQQASVDQEDAPSQEIIAVDLEDEYRLDLVSVGEQTQAMLRLVFGFGILVLIVAFWSEAIPVLRLLDDVTVPLVELNCLQVVSALVAVAVTYGTVRNLSGLLELTVLRRKSLQPGARHAISTLCKYVIVAFGAAAVFNILNLDWSKFGWMVTAFSVGIGFGLQEVVANFVCGLILLSEQPIRVGDVVTLEGTTGTVTRIHLRATTITNWDRQEFVVPNKNLITGTILNWTLNATVNRVVIPVGVAYGSDLEEAMQILLDVANEHPKIMDDPGPISSVEQFADSAVNLMLRAYLPDLDGRIQITTELYSEISKRFAEAGIEIPFPQQDVHLPKEFIELNLAPSSGR